MDLRAYEYAKFELSGLLQAIMEHRSMIEEHGLYDREEHGLYDRLQDLLARLAEDRFNLVVAGRFSRGKSSLMNAIIGVDRLPTGIVPLTSVITTVSYGTKERVTLAYKRGGLGSEISLEELPRYVTQEGNPGNTLGLSIVRIELAAEILRRGIYFVDTPGLGSVIAENTETTQAYFPEADGLLLVTSFESPLSDEELNIFARAARAGLPTFVAINKQDLIAESERQGVLDFVRHHLQDLQNQSPLGLFSVSARDGLAAKLSGDADRLRASGLPALEQCLVQFLIQRKRAVFLDRMCVRVEQLVSDLPVFDGSDHLQRKVQAILQKYRQATRPDEQTPIDDVTAYFNRKQLHACQICAAVEEETQHHLARYQYELATDETCQADFARRSGFCCYHTGLYQAIASPAGTCSGYPPLLEHLAQAFRDAADGTENGLQTKLAALLPRHETCPLCASRDAREAGAVAEVAEQLSGSGRAELEALSALCLPHLTAVAELIDDPEILRPLLRQQALALERTAEDMRRAVLKQSAARRNLETDEERTADRRGLMLVTGRRNVNFAVGQSAIQAKAPSGRAPGLPGDDGR